MWGLNPAPASVRKSTESKMGTLIYNGAGFLLDDRVFAHLQIVIATKLRRRESFTVSWRVPVDRGSGRRTLWVDNSVPIHLDYQSSRVVSINRVWVERMLASAARAEGLRLEDEPAD
jgi:hypothetical protein